MSGSETISDDVGTVPGAPVTTAAVHEGAPVRGRHRHARRSGAAEGRRETRAVATGRFVVLACGPDDVAAVDAATGAFVRLRMAMSEERPDMKPFDVIEVQMGLDPERDDMAQPEAVSVVGPAQVLGTANKRRVRRILRSLVAPNERNLLGFPGLAAPYWEFRGMRPSLALVVPSIGPLLFRRRTDDTTWVRFGWSRNDNWLPVEDPRALACLWASGRDKLTGKDLAGALGFRPRYLLVSLSPPRSGHCYKTVTAILPRP